MGTFNSWLRTSRSFRVKDYSAFKAELEQIGRVYEVNDLSEVDHDTLAFMRDKTGEIRMAGLNEGMFPINDLDEEVDVTAIIQRHLMPGSIAAIYEVAVDQGFSLMAEVTIITSTMRVSKTMDDVEEELVGLGQQEFLGQLPTRVRLLSSTQERKHCER